MIDVGCVTTENVARPTTTRIVMGNVRAERRVQIGAFKRWLAQPGATPAEKTARQRIREILVH